jgi:hypothetical protein
MSRTVSRPGDASGPVPTGTGGPADGVGGPQQRFQSAPGVTSAAPAADSLARIATKAVIAPPALSPMTAAYAGSAPHLYGSTFVRSGRELTGPATGRSSASGLSVATRDVGHEVRQQSARRLWIFEHRGVPDVLQHLDVHVRNDAVLVG